MATYDQTSADAGTVAAVFNDRESARDAVADLHDAGYHHAWLGVTRTDLDDAGEPTLESEGAGGFMEAVGRFFSGDGSDGRALHETLVHRGLSEQQARRIDASIVPGNAVVTVDGNDDPGGATRIMRRAGGRIEGSVAPLDDDDLNDEGSGYAAGRTPDDVDGADRIQLREERLAVDKQRVASGEVRVGKRVVTEQQSVDVPVFREELYIERRPAGDTALRQRRSAKAKRSAYRSVRSAST